LDLDGAGLDAALVRSVSDALDDPTIRAALEAGMLTCYRQLLWQASYPKSLTAVVRHN
jgi:hypothetical protein